MESLTRREKELVALGASIGSNCIPCIAYHIAEAKKTGLSDSQVKEAIQLAEKVKQVPAGLVLNTAYAQLGDNSTSQNGNCETEKPICCG